MSGVRTEEQERSQELHLARDAFNNEPYSFMQGSFLYHLTLAFIKADGMNFEILRPIMLWFIAKYPKTFHCGCARDSVRIG